MDVLAVAPVQAVLVERHHSMPMVCLCQNSVMNVETNIRYLKLSIAVCVEQNEFNNYIFSCT